MYLLRKQKNPKSQNQTTSKFKTIDLGAATDAANRRNCDRRRDLGSTVVVRCDRDDGREKGDENRKFHARDGATYKKKKTKQNKNNNQSRLSRALQFSDCSLLSLR